jgi:hypothetical protein
MGGEKLDRNYGMVVFVYSELCDQSSFAQDQDGKVTFYVLPLMNSILCFVCCFWGPGRH